MQHHIYKQPTQPQQKPQDPEGLFNKAPVRQGIIETKLMNKRIESDQEYKVKMEAVIKQERDELQKKRESRVIPNTPAGLIEFFLDTEAPEMEFEVARCRKQLDEEFFTYLDKLTSLERLAVEPDEDRLAELEALTEYLKSAVNAVDTAATAVAKPADRLKELLMAKDKKAFLIEMAGNNEIDQPFLDLLQQNIDGAKASGQTDAAEFMTKVQQAAMRFRVTSTATSTPAMPAPPTSLSSGGGDNNKPTSPSGLIY